MRSYNGNLTIYQHAEGIGQVRWSSINAPSNPFPLSSKGKTLLYNSSGSIIGNIREEKLFFVNQIFIIFR